jgi:hypothetical protein
MVAMVVLSDCNSAAAQYTTCLDSNLRGPYCNEVVLVPIPSGHRLWSIVQNPDYDAAQSKGDPRLTTHWSRCSHCNRSFGAVTRDTGI